MSRGESPFRSDWKSAPEWKIVTTSKSPNGIESVASAARTASRKKRAASSNDACPRVQGP
jgi:hypothetical protein